MSRMGIRGKGILLLGLALGSAASAGEPTLEQRVQRLERRVDQVGELVLEMEALKRSNRELLGRVEALQHQLRQLQKKQREIYLDLDQRITRLQGENGAPPVAEAQPSSPGKASTEEAPPKPAGALSSAERRRMRQAYDAAYALLQSPKRDYKKAAAAFQAFLKKYPRGELSDNALYWLGEIRFVEGKNEAALANFDELLQRFPDSEKVPGALLKKGYVLQALGRKAEARRTLQLLVDKYPEASVTRMAKARLKKLK